ncbi:hypothetical protein FHU33_2449 [Blastococcus colisei]|uniref:Uncharacterized protein n=1 Tax=Blastococcus colisei TaxID=1564162 RepID=A0A543PG28_9ACTN|nr:hypothetical protein [Blastococcus colisei]TQN43028.1 hypothetical protein FHU33_2449 [Blastococcus colisei]
MSEQRPDTDERDEPAGTSSPGPDNLTARPATPGTDDARQAAAVPGAYEADDAERKHGKAVKPGN